MILISSVHFSALWLFLSIQTACSPLKRFLEPSDIETATGPFIDDVLYADKTSYILNLFNAGKRFFFVRPRRFGKSSFLRSLQRILDGSGRRIFNGTFIHRSDYSWDTYPVLYLDFGNDVIEDIDTCEGIAKTPRDLTLLEIKVDETLGEFKTKYNLTKPKKTRFSDEFASILKEMDQKKYLTVVLIDEYDFAILNNMKRCPIAELINTELVREFFYELKDKAGCLRFAFVTGISRSVFASFGSKFDLIDLTHDTDFQNIAGLTQPELEKYCEGHIEEVSNITGKSRNVVNEEMKKWYDGYNFSVYPQFSLYNPWSMNGYFREKKAKKYSADKGYAEFLFHQMAKRPYAFSVLNLKENIRSDLSGSQYLNQTAPAVLLYDAGYLTIKNELPNGLYELDFPNKEMEEAYYRDIADAARTSENGTEHEIYVIQYALQKPEPDFDTFARALNVAMRKLIIRPPFEEWYDWMTMNFLKDAGIIAERQTHIKTIEFGGKDVDVTGYTENFHFLIEIKFNYAGNSKAWAAVNKSIKAWLDENKKKEEPSNLLAAGITFGGRVNEDALTAYQAKLFTPDGRVKRRYQSEHLVKKNDTTLFSKDYLFIESSVQSSIPSSHGDNVE